MSNGDDVIICGSTEPFTDKQIWVYDSAVSVAVKIDTHALEDAAVAAGMDRDKAKRRIKRFVHLVENDWWRWGEYLEDRLCVDYVRHDPHPQNFQP